MRAFWGAVSRVKGGSGGRDMQRLLEHSNCTDRYTLYQSVQDVKPRFQLQRKQLHGVGKNILRSQKRGTWNSAALTNWYGTSKNETSEQGPSSSRRARRAAEYRSAMVRCTTC